MLCASQYSTVCVVRLSGGRSTVFVFVFIFPHAHVSYRVPLQASVLQLRLLHVFLQHFPGSGVLLAAHPQGHVRGHRLPQPSGQQHPAAAIRVH